MIVSVKFVSVPAQDQDRALAFYTEKLGFRLITDQPFGPKQRWIELGIDHSDTRFVLFTPPGEEGQDGPAVQRAPSGLRRCRGYLPPALRARSNVRSAPGAPALGRVRRHAGL